MKSRALTSEEEKKEEKRGKKMAKEEAKRKEERQDGKMGNLFWSRQTTDRLAWHIRRLNLKLREKGEELCLEKKSKQSEHDY